MRAHRVLTILLATLQFCGCMHAPEGIVGRYAQHIDARDNPPWRGMIGDWEFEFRADGRFSVRQIGGQTVEGVYRLDGDILTINDFGGSGPCRANGVDLASALYRVRLHPDGIEMKPLRDECRGRRESLPIGFWKHVP